MKLIFILLLSLSSFFAQAVEDEQKPLFQLLKNNQNQHLYYVLNDERLAEIIELHYYKDQAKYPYLKHISQTTKYLYFREFRSALIENLNRAEKPEFSCLLNEELVRQFLLSFRDAGLLSQKGIRQRQLELVLKWGNHTCLASTGDAAKVDVFLAEGEDSSLFESAIEKNDSGIKFLSLESEKELLKIKKATIVGSLFFNRYEDLAQSHQYQDLFATNEHKAGAKLDINLPLVKALSYRMSFSLYHEGEDNDEEAGEWFGKISHGIRYSPHEYLRFSLSYELEKPLSPRGHVTSEWKLMGSYVPKAWR